MKIAIKKYEQHPSINLIKENITNNESFYFLPTELESILKEIINLDNKKNGTFKNIPTRRLKDVSDICSPILANIWNEEILLNKIFLENLKLADVSPIFKKKDKTVSKIFERIMQKTSF